MSHLIDIQFCPHMRITWKDLQQTNKQIKQTEYNWEKNTHLPSTKLLRLYSKQHWWGRAKGYSLNNYDTQTFQEPGLVINLENIQHNIHTTYNINGFNFSGPQDSLNKSNLLLCEE